MKLRCLPEDFQVEELATVEQNKAGPFSLYRMTKRSLTTPDAIDAVIERWKLERRQISYGGLKDKHAISRQYITVHRGPRRGLQQSNVDLEYLGTCGSAFDPGDIQGNGFEIVMRSMSAEECALAERALPEVRSCGLPNYFDDQRFGSLSPTGEFIAEPWVKGNYERSIWLTFAEPFPNDDRQELKQKQILREHWGDWLKCKAELDRSHRRSVITYLCDKPTDFRGAWARVRVDLRSLYLSAFQSFLWNGLLAAWLRKHLAQDQLVNVELKPGPVPFFRQVPEELQRTLRSMTLPLPSARLHLEPGPMLEFVETSLAKMGWTLREIRVKYPRDSFFSRGERGVVLDVQNLSWTTGDDELYNGRKKLSLKFQLPRGSYATMLVKRITVAAGTNVEELES